MQQLLYYTQDLTLLEKIFCKKKPFSMKNVNTFLNGSSKKIVVHIALYFFYQCIEHETLGSGLLHMLLQNNSVSGTYRWITKFLVYWEGIAILF